MEGRWKLSPFTNLLTWSTRDRKAPLIFYPALTLSGTGSTRI